MNISLTPELEKRIKQKVDTGLYNNASEVVREALRFVELHQDWVDSLKLASLQKQIDQGLAELDVGQGIRIHSSAELDALFEEIQRT